MKKWKKWLALVMALVIAVGGGLLLADALSAPPSETNAFAGDYYVPPINQFAPFFDVILPQIEENIEEYNTHTVTPSFDKLPVLNNPENFQGLGSTTYANINGKTVTAEAFYRVSSDSAHDPNCGMGLLIYQCIQYKRAHPDEDVKICFSSYRTSASASVCVIPGSKYYGYMRSLYTTNYDEQGFVRISYMLVEAARMGIEVTMVNHLSSYSVSQYNPTTKKNKSKANLNFERYFNEAMDSDCYISYAAGKKVSDYLTFGVARWLVDERGSDMHHVKGAAVSHYLATDGTEHSGSVFLSTANLDDNNYLGRNGNGSSQSGVIVSDHDEIYRVTYNYLKLLTNYLEETQVYAMRDKVMQLNAEQIRLIKEGRESEIPRDEQIVYLGSENDPVFEMYFTPFGGSPEVWDPEMNPLCKYVDEFVQSTEYVEFTWNEFAYGGGYIGETLSKKLEMKYCSDPDPKNKIALRVDNFNTDAIAQLEVGTEIGYRSIRDGAGIHAKDYLLNYEKDGVRHRVSIMTSCNFGSVPFSYRTNSMLIINETDETGGDFYRILGKKYSYGMIK
ncbi:MAG: hypothetical protein IJB26_00995 [Clostridia bacterium]|nr:hypothetical protein [Clostridia bacterium]